MTFMNNPMLTTWMMNSPEGQAYFAQMLAQQGKTPPSALPQTAPATSFGQILTTGQPTTSTMGWGAPGWPFTVTNQNPILAPGRPGEPGAPVPGFPMPGRMPMKFPQMSAQELKKVTNERLASLADTGLNLDKMRPGMFVPRTAEMPPVGPALNLDPQKLTQLIMGG
jgi:hypothetical protein